MTWDATIQFYSMKCQVYQFLSQNKDNVVVSAEISVKNVFFEIRLDDIFLILSLRYGSNHISIQQNLLLRTQTKSWRYLEGLMIFQSDYMAGETHFCRFL